ncbi:hypothetical protein AAFC00_001758 [Neodothiora populina]|uniref:GTP:AMP phosphotransferase, mitochondrial n=1 Tax=Neodothiora populina TaxID=2781224 RepID=A0ABR3PQB5_9PEZI
MKLRKAARIILVGAPGVGKGTQTERMLERFPQLASISSGDILRDNVRSRTVLGIQAESIMKSGSLVPDATMLRLIMSELSTRGWIRSTGPRKPITLNCASTAFAGLNASAAQGGDEYLNTSVAAATSEKQFEYSNSPDASFILDGFPRTASQADELDKIIPINLVVHIKTPIEVILDRICNRWIHAPSGRVYNTTFHAPKVAGKDDITGEPLVQRADDEPETWKARLHKFEETSKPLLDHYDSMGVLWKVEGNSSDEITPKLFDEFTRRFGT